MTYKLASWRKNNADPRDELTEIHAELNVRIKLYYLLTLNSYQLTSFFVRLKHHDGE